MASVTPSTSGLSDPSSQPAAFKIVGVILAVVSGLLIGASFVFKKKGLIASQKGGPAGEGVAYLKSPMWWTGMIMMILGELCNFGSYAFVPAVIVTPLGALSVVICAILSSIFLNESLTFFGWCGCFLCIVGSTIIALNGPQEGSASTIKEFQHLFLSLGFIIYGSLVILTALIIMFFIAPRYGTKSMLWYIMVCSLFGGLSVSCTQGLGSSIVTTIRGENQFKYWFIYFLLVFVAVTLVTEIFFLNKALALFNTAMVTPTYYVIFTFFTLVTSVILFQGLHATVVQIITVVLGFLVICCGIVILQMSKVDPTSLKGLDRKSTILLQASREHVDGGEKGDVSAMEEPGMDALRGSFGAFGSVIRARSVRSSIAGRSVSGGSNYPHHGYQRHGRRRDEEEGGSGASELTTRGLADLPRHQLYDAPVSLPGVPEDEDGDSQHARNSTGLSASASQGLPAVSPRTRTIQFDTTDHRHFYSPTPGRGDLFHQDPSITPTQKRHSGVTLSTQSGSQVPEYSDEDEAFNPRTVPIEHVRGVSDRFSPGMSGQDSVSTHKRNQSSGDPFRDTPNSSQANLVSRKDSIDSSTGLRDNFFGGDDDRSSSPEESRRPFHSRTRAYPGGPSSDEDDDMARESLVANDSGSSRGGIRLIPRKSPRKI